VQDNQKSNENGERKMKTWNESAVSPVVGVMLMLVVVIIIAAVVSGFAGGLVGSNNQKVPKLTMDAKIVNSGYWSTSYFKSQVTAVDAPINTRDLKIVTSWSKKLENGTTISDGATIVPGKLNYNVSWKVGGIVAFDTWQNVCPQGYGPGVGNGTQLMYYILPFEWPGDLTKMTSSSGLGHPATMDDVWAGRVTNFSWFGNYKLQAGTIMFARPFGGKMDGGSKGNSGLTVGYGMAATSGTTGGGRYNYCYGTDPSSGPAYFYPADATDHPSVDQMMAVLGNNWNLLRAGDTVTMKVIHTPTGKIIWQRDIIVEG